MKNPPTKSRNNPQAEPWALGLMAAQKGSTLQGKSFAGRSFREANEDCLSLACPLPGSSGIIPAFQLASLD
jgi:hypothetical protein